MMSKNAIALNNFHENTDESSIKVHESDCFFNIFLPEMQTSWNMRQHFPAITISESGASIIVQAELPNMTTDDILVSLHKNSLLIKGDKKSTIEELYHEDSNENPNRYIIDEIVYGKFARRIDFPFDLDPFMITATFFQSLLTITIEKPEHYRYRSMSIPILSED